MVETLGILSILKIVFLGVWESMLMYYLVILKLGTKKEQKNLRFSGVNDVLIPLLLLSMKKVFL